MEITSDDFRFEKNVIYSLRERIQNRSNNYGLPDPHIESLTDDRRADHFFRICGKTHEIWTAWENNILPIFETKEKSEVIYCWPSRQLAQKYSAKKNTELEIVPIPIDDFINEVFLNIGKRCHIGVFPLHESSMVVMSQSDFTAQLYYSFSPKK